LVDLDKVDAVIANDFGFVVAPLLPLVEKRKGLLLAIGLSQEQYCKIAPNSFFSIASEVSRSKAAYNHFFELHPEVKRIGLVVFDDPEWGHAYRAIWQALATERGITIVDTFLNNEWKPDFKTALTRMLAKKPDAILFAHEPEGMIKAAAQLKFTKPLVAANNVLEMLADKNSARPELNEVYLVDPGITDEFRKRFSERFKRSPILEAYAGYEALRALAKAAQENRKDLAAGMRHVRYAGVAGPIDFTTGRCSGNQSSWELFRFVNGAQTRQ
jgi:ABC-type branched-subunit amino acid transport system substrate-binding protein